jgi:hypothetical protein
MTESHSIAILIFQQLESYTQIHIHSEHVPIKVVYSQIHKLITYCSHYVTTIFL